MNRGGITTRLVRLSQALIGHLRGGLAHVNILSSILFAGLSGSAVADTSAIGSMLIPAMEKMDTQNDFLQQLQQHHLLLDQLFHLVAS